MMTALWVKIEMSGDPMHGDGSLDMPSSVTVKQQLMIVSIGIVSRLRLPKMSVICGPRPRYRHRHRRRGNPAIHPKRVRSDK